MKTVNCSRLHPSKMNKLPSSVLNPIHTYPIITLGIVVCGMLTLIAAFLCMCRKSQSFGDEHSLEEFRQAMQSKIDEVRAWGDAKRIAAGTLCDDTSSEFGSDDCYASLEIENEIKKALAQDCGGGGDAGCVQVEEEDEKTMDVEETQFVDVEETEAVEVEEIQTAEVEETIVVEVEEIQTAEVEETLVVEVKEG